MPFVRAIRAREWWDPKLSPILGTGYATAYLLGVSVASVALALLVALVALIAGAAWVSVLNDVTDREVDAAAGKTPRTAALPRRFAATTLAGCVLAGLAIALLAWRSDPAILAVYAGAWLAFGLYSIPPARLKDRGLPGVLADATGAHGCPQTLVALVVFAAADQAVEGTWIVLVAVWALAFGIRGVLWHQLGDVAADERSGVRTFARRRPRAARRLVTWGVFPVELVALLGLLLDSHAVLPALALVPYALLEAFRVRAWGNRIIVAAGGAPGARTALLEYYVVFLPLAFLLASALEHPADALVLVLHVVLFSGAIRQTAIATLAAARRLSPPAPRARARS